MTSPNVSKAHNLLGEALDPECGDPWHRIDQAHALLEDEIDG